MNNVGKVFRYCKFSLFADDLKIYLPVSSISENLQSDLNQLVNWCTKNGIFINISKWVHIFFHHHKSLVNFKYQISSYEIIEMD